MTYTKQSQIDTPKKRAANHLFALLIFLTIRPLGAQGVEPYVSPGGQIGWSGEGLFISFQVSAGVLSYIEPILIAPAVTVGYRLYRGGNVLFLDGQATVLLGRGSTSPFAIGMGTGRAWLNSKEFPETQRGSHSKMYAGLFFLGVLDNFSFGSGPEWRDMGVAFTFPISLSGQAYAN